ncbi:hypothetical protein [Mycobacterium sherrisii]|uniref:hypothetical protein n=1 Tax=Mycobacterium sherrisii TaxID=243061 RepID=UPI0027E2FFA1|nr:hypothetical protein [Mycobacterium sherrisii]
MPRPQYEDLKRRLPIEPLKLQNHGKRTGGRPARYAEFIQQAPRVVVRSNDKKRARINAMRSVLAQSEYADKDYSVVGEPDAQIVGRAPADWAAPWRRCVRHDESRTPCPPGSSPAAPPVSDARWPRP